MCTQSILGSLDRLLPLIPKCLTWQINSALPCFVPVSIYCIFSPLSSSFWSLWFLDHLLVWDYVPSLTKRKKQIYIFVFFCQFSLVSINLYAFRIFVVLNNDKKSDSCCIPLTLVITVKKSTEMSSLKRTRSFVTSMSISRQRAQSMMEGREEERRRSELCLNIYMKWKIILQ